MLLIGTGSAWAAASLMGTDFPNGNWDGGISLPCTLYLETKTYNFKVKENGTWYEDKNEGTMNPGDSWQFYNYSKGNTKLKITTAGYYTLSWNENTNTFSVVEAIATAYVVGGYYGGDKNYSTGKKLTEQSDGTYSGTFSGFSGSCYFQIYDDIGRVWGCDYVKKNVGESVTLNTSKNDKVEYSLTNGISYIFSFNPSDGTFLVKTSCTDPKAADFSYTDPKYTYDGTAKSATVKWADDNTTTGITIKYGNSTTAPTNAGTYAITVSTTAHGNICASKSDISLGDFTINKADQKALSISTDAVVCGKSVTLATSGGTGNGAVSYTLSENTANATVSNGVLSATTSGSVKVKATKSGGTNYNDATVEKTFNFTMPIENVTLTKVNDSKTTYCVGDRAEFKLTYSGPYPTSYAWSGTAMGSLEATGKTAKVLDNGASWYIDFSEAKTYTIALSLTGCNTDASDELSFTVNALPTAPTFTTNSVQVCSGVAFNLNEKFPRNSGEAGTLTWYKASDDSQVTDPASVTITEVTSYYAKATNINCTSAKSFDCTVNVDTKPTLELASTPTVCPNVEIDLDDYATYNTGTLTWYSNQERTTVITDGLVTPTERTTYYAKVTNGTCNPVENEFTVDVYGIPDEMPAYTSTPATSCKETPNSDGTIALKNTIGYITYTLDGKEGDSNVWTRLSVGTHKLAATINTCPSLTKEWDVEVGVEDITPTATVSITGDVSFCEGGNTVLTSVVTATQGEVTAYQWYNGEELIQGATASRYTTNAAGNYKVVVTVNNNDCVDTFEATIEVRVKNKPTTPAFNPNFTSICVGGSTTLASGYSWYTDLNASALANLTVSPQTETTYYAIKEDNGCTSDAGTFTVKVNPLPRITAISVNNSTPVINEDVLLTVEGSDIARVEWSITSGNNASLSDASGNSVKLTSTTSGTVTVTATTTSGAGCTATSTKEVTFSETEDCTPEEVIVKTTNIEIWCRENGGNAGSNLKCYAWDNNKTEIFGSWAGSNSPNRTETREFNGNTYTYKVWVFDASKYTAPYKVIFSNNSGNQTGDLETGEKNYKYFFWYNASESDKSKNSGKDGDAESLSYKDKEDKPITAPAVKTVSATSEEGSGIVTFTGKVLKTGCANGDAIWVGYQYKKANEAWPTTGVTAGSGEKQLVTITNNPGSEDFTANVEGLENGNYHFRAYIINGYNFTNGNYNQGVYYGLDKLVTVSTTKTPISNVTLNYYDKNGGNVGVDPNPMCKGATAYVKLSYEGSKYSDIKWLVEGVETNLVTDKGNGVWSYEIQGDGSLSVELKNDANTDPAWPYSNKLAFTIIPEPTAPYISIDPASGVICQGSSATIKVENPSTACSYKLVEERSKAGFEPYKSGDLKYTVQNVAKYYVVAQHNACTDNEYTSNQVAINQIISTSAKISIEPEEAETTPWEPVSITVTADEGYVYEVTYTGNNLQDVEGVIIKQKGDTYTYYIPRPTGWGEGDAVSVRTPVSYDIKAQLKVDGEANQCDLSFDTATITVKDEEDEDCD